MGHAACPVPGSKNLKIFVVFKPELVFTHRNLYHCLAPDLFPCPHPSFHPQGFPEGPYAVPFHITGADVMQSRSVSWSL